jgi:hypothetical protein
MNKPKKNVQEFLNKLNALLREESVCIDFTSGNLYCTQFGYVGILEDDKTALFLVEEETGEILYETEST